MATVTIHFEEQSIQVQSQTECLISDLLRLHNHAVQMPCAGKGKCGKCRVKATGNVSPITAEEKNALSEDDINSGVRLACCTRIWGDVDIALYSDARYMQIEESGIMPVGIEKPLFTRYGAAVDIGTTTLAARLYSQDGLLASCSAANTQRTYGADVISRIGQALNGKGQELAACIQNAVGELLVKLEQKANLPARSIDSMVVTGNTAMLYLFTGENPDCLAHAPFEADELFGKYVEAAYLSLPCAKGAKVYLPRCMSAFVGADITTALLASGICEQPQTALLADIGTNGEMALWHQQQLFCCSTAAGPAFEGAGLSKGMQGVEGAIDHISLSNDRMDIHVIGEGIGTGICGSGIVDALAVMKEAQILDETGLILDEGHAFVDRIIDDDELSLALNETVTVSQKDIRMVQLAKSAVCAGMRTLPHAAGIELNDIQLLAIAGGFGSYLDLDSAAKIGLYPEELRKKAVVLGNAALGGAVMLLLNADLIPKSASMANSAQTVDLSTNPTFMDYYMDGMIF